MAHRLFNRPPARNAPARAGGFSSRWTRSGRQLKLGWKHQAGKLGYILLWALGVPIPVLFLFYLLRGCN